MANSQNDKKTFNTSVTKLSNILVKKKSEKYMKRGTIYHKMFEQYLKNKTIPSNMNYENEKIFSLFLNYIDHIKYLELIDVEVNVENTFTYKNVRFTINGRIDAIFKEKSNKFLYDADNIYIIDWKITSSISPDNLKLYETILNIYGDFYQNKYPYAKIKIYLVLFSELNINFKVIEVKYLKNSLEDIIKKLNDDEFQNICDHFEKSK